MDDANREHEEVYATTGPRMIVRMFGGFDFTETDALRHDVAAIGYAKSVPMGADITTAPRGKTPTFLVSALKDANGANLDRTQIVKGWVGADGKLQETIFDVAVSDDRQIVGGEATKCKAQGPTLPSRTGSHLLTQSTRSWRTIQSGHRR